MIIYKTAEEIKIMRVGGKILAGILKKLADAAGPGVSTGQLEELACALIEQAGGRPSFKGFRSFDDKPFPTALCASINDEVVHAPALPSRVLQSGDILKIDIGMEYPHGLNFPGCFTDMAVTVPIGKVGEQAKKLIKTTKNALILAIKKVKPGNSMFDIGEVIQDYVEARGFSVVRDLVGHGVGRSVHEEPQVPHFKVKKGGHEDIKLAVGMTLAIEPMINAGGWRVKYDNDGFTIRTADGGLSAQFEHTVAVVKGGCIIITAL